MNRLLLAALLLAPAPDRDEVREQNRQRVLQLQAQAVAALPGAGEAVISALVPINSEAQDSEGTVYSLTGSLLLTIKRAAIPDPTTTKLTALKIGGESVTTGQSGDLLVLEGTLLSNASTPVKVTVAGKAGIVVTASPTRIEVRLPVVTAAVTGPVILYWSSAAGPTERARVAVFTVRPAGAVDGRSPTILGYQLTDGTRIGARDGQPLGAAVYGQPVIVEGRNLGSLPGRVWLGGMTAQEVLAWSDTEVRIRVNQTVADDLPPSGMLQLYNPVSHAFEFRPITREEMLATARPLHLALRTVEGRHASSMAFAVRRP